MGGKATRFEVEAIRELLAGDGVRTPFGGPQVWSTKIVRGQSGLDRGLLHWVCCQLIL